METILIENPSADGPFGAKAIGEMANNAQPPAIATAIYDAIGVWVTRAADHARAGAAGARRQGRGPGEPRREGKVVIFDDEISLNTHASADASLRFSVHRVSSPFRTWNGVDLHELHRRACA